ncbi:unnamed protein product, partial [Prorocentrum cordatum]
RYIDPLLGTGGDRARARLLRELTARLAPASVEDSFTYSDKEKVTVVTAHEVLNSLVQKSSSVAGLSDVPEWATDGFATICTRLRELDLPVPDAPEDVVGLYRFVRRVHAQAAAVRSRT